MAAVNTNQHFTHIVVGAGSAGSIVAARIASNPNFNVLLVEAGPDYNGKTDTALARGIRNSRRVPMKGQTDIFDPSIDWNVSVRMSERDHEIMTVPQAKVVGGGSSINGGTALRNTPRDAEEWQAYGNAGWSFDEMRRVYDELEDDDLRATKGAHPIRRAKGEELGEIQKAFVKGAQEAGFKYVEDQNEAGAEGVSPSPVCRRGDQRISVANTFIDPIRSQSNITILSDALVDRVLFHHDHHQQARAIGIVLPNGDLYYATHETILCCGAIFTPALLQRSGIGPSNLLTSLHIPVILDQPNIGQHLQDHPCIPIVARPLPNAYNENDYSLQTNARWTSALSPSGKTDLQLVCFSYLYSPAPDPQVPDAEKQRTLGGAGVSGHVAGVGCNINKLTSVGYVKITSRDPKVQPEVVANYLTTEHDRVVARECVRRGYAVLTSPAMQKVVGPPIGIDDAVSTLR